MLTGTLAFSSVCATPMMAFADEATAQDQQDQQLINIVDGVYQGDDETALQAQGYMPRGNVSMMFYNPYSVNVPRYAYNRGRNTRNVYVNDVYFAPTVASYTPYNGAMSTAWYSQYAGLVVSEVRKAVNDNVPAGGSKQDALDQIDRYERLIRSAGNVAAVSGYLDGIYGYVNGCSWNSRINWNNYFTTDKYGRWRKDCYLPYDWDWRWDCGRYDCSYTPSDAAKTTNVYRLVNGKGVHVFVNSTTKANEFEAAGWEKEGKAFTSLASSSKPVYQLYNDANVYTYALTAEAYETLANNGWHKDGVAFYASDSGTKVYCFEDKDNHSVVFTKSAAERKELQGSSKWVDNGVIYVNK
jgi:hypothetical protein